MQSEQESQTVVEHTTPQLGGDLDMNGNDIVTLNANIDLSSKWNEIVNLIIIQPQELLQLRFNEDTDDGSNYPS